MKRIIQLSAAFLSIAVISAGLTLHRTVAEPRATLKDGWRAAVPASSRAAKEGEPWQSGKLAIFCRKTKVKSWQK